MKVGSLFAGIGGIELGFKRAGFETGWFVECEPYAQQILKKHWPDAIIYDDVTQIDFRTVPKVEILTGGFPCQDISNAGKRAGIEGSRSSLWKHYLRAIREIRPKYAFIENVSALINRGLFVVLADLAEIGYDAEWHCVTASSVGANHQRDRVFILAYPNDSRHIHRQSKEQPTETREHAFSESMPSSTNVPNTRCNATRSFSRKEEGGEHSNKHSNRDKIWRNITDGCGVWATEPNVDRVAYGVPFRVDRIKCLGNAVVPQVAEVFARAIKEMMTK